MVQTASAAWTSITQRDVFAERETPKQLATTQDGYYMLYTSLKLSKAT